MTTLTDPLLPAPEPAGPPAVSRFEYNLLRILRFLLGYMPADQAQTLVYAKFQPAPPCLTRTCVRLIRDTLSKATVLHLVRAGGWRRDRFLRAGQPVEGRVWDRLPLASRELAFSKHTLSFLVWLTSEKPTDTKEVWDAPPSELTPGDELFFSMAFDALRPLQDVVPAIAGKNVFDLNPLCWLLCPADFANTDEPELPNFSPYMMGTRAAILECLQPVLAQRWIRSERSKGQIGDWKRMRHQGRAELAMLASFLKVAETSGRTDLARFVLRTATVILGNAELAPSFWTGGLQGSGPLRLADRLDTQRSALALPRQLDTLHRWDRAARAIGYFDDGYEASQLWKADWELARGDEITARAKRILDQLEPLKI